MTPPLTSLTEVPAGRPINRGDNTDELLTQLAELADHINNATDQLGRLRDQRTSLIKEAARRGASVGVIADAVGLSRTAVHRATQE